MTVGIELGDRIERIRLEREERKRRGEKRERDGRKRGAKIREETLLTFEELVD